MSRTGSAKQGGLKLPFDIQKQLGIHNDSLGRDARVKTTVADRKQRRKDSRMSKRSQHDDQSSVAKAAYKRKTPRSAPEPTITYEAKHNGLLRAARPNGSARQPKPILKKPRNDSEPHPAPEPTDSDETDRSCDSSPGLILDASSKSFKDRQAQDDAEIAALEKKLGMRKKKSSKAGEDTLDFLLDGLDEEDLGHKRKRDEQQWLQNKRMKAQESIDEEDEEVLSDDEGSSEDLGSQNSAQSSEYEDEDSNKTNDSTRYESEMRRKSAHFTPDNGEDDGFSGFDSDTSVSQSESQPKRVRENPYIAPVPRDSANTAKYVPPSMRKRNEQDEQVLVRLKRQVQGHLNKLSEANMISVLSGIEDIYRNNPRQDVTNVLIDLLLSLLCNRSALQNTFIILHASFTSALYKILGTDFGAEMLAKLVESFDREHERDETHGKEALNLISFLANLFTFNMVSSNIVFDHIRLLLSAFGESNAELLLRVVRDCGPQLRADDPSALKGIVQMMQNISADMVKNGQQLNVRTKVMIDTITDLKNNKIRASNTTAGAAGEHITRMRKALGSLNNRTLKAVEPLRITRDDIANSDKKGKWWLVGASWKGNEAGNPVEEDEKALGRHSHEFLDDEIDFMALAKQYRMNTDVRRSIFVAIMSANDCRDAQNRMVKLRLTNKQEQEIAKVVLRCARSETAYNPYYTLLTKNLCKDSKRLRMGFQFALWDFFRAMGERDEGDEDEAGDENQTVELHEVANVAKMYAYLVFNGHLTLGILKTLNIGFLKDQATMFLEVFLISLMTQHKSDEEKLTRACRTVGDAPHIAKSLQFFIKKQVRRSDLISKKDKAQVKDGCRIAENALTSVGSSRAEIDE